jgi:UDP-glucose 4-epimerase
MSVLVTGGLGFIGSNLIESLLQEDHKITCVDNHSSARADAYQFVKKHEDRVSFWHECFSHEKILNKIHNKEFDVVFHIAAVPRVSYSVENPYKTTNVNIDKTVKLLEACRGNVVQICCRHQIPTKKIQNHHMRGKNLPLKI